ncbi:MAG: putative quinol monooxygenase [Bryobacteraceae bacterium]
MLTVVAEMQAKPGKEEALKQQLLALIEPTRKEEGCVQYDLHVGTDSAGQFVFYENWTSRELLDRHLASPHLRAFLAVAGGLLVEPPRIATYNRIA